ncbi:MAG: hypothetical protein U5R14_08105 [Gemmatimonadota bacterium]|nr:hypothetical protein [Gemmatimonadota bacterium]
MRSIRSLHALVATAALAFLASASDGHAQEPEQPLLRGEVLVGDAPLDTGTVVLHQVTDIEQGEIDSVGVSEEGSFSFRLPSPPDRAAERFYFASVRHAGILYFGSALATTTQLDSIYRIQAYDTAMVAEGGADIPLQARNIFFEPNGEEWRVTDIFQLRNDGDRTLIAPEGGAVWRYPLPEGARDFSSGQGEFAIDGTLFRDGVVSVRAAISPGERVFVFRYAVDDPFGPVPTPGNTEAFDLLVREPSPRVGVEGLELQGRVELEQGSTYRRYSGIDVGPGRVSVIETEQEGEIPMEWVTVLVGLALAVAALFVLKGRQAPAAAGVGGSPSAGSVGAAGANRQAVLVEIARLDEAFESNASPTDEERAAYEARRAELLRQLEAVS